MSRSFQVITEKNPDFTVEEILNIIKTLKNSDKEINLENIRIINHSEYYNTFVTEDCIVHITFHSTEWDGKIHKWWSVESRALYGMGKNLFVACASAVAILADGYASSCDGAFIISDTNFTGQELWETHLDSRPFINVSTVHGDKICRCKSEVKKIILNILNDDIWISIGKDYPCLAILINGKYACIHYFEDENGTAFQSVGDVNKEITFIAGGTEWTAPPEAVVTLDEAVICAESFINKLSRPECIEWTEL
ncbi:MAG: hypothetical protein NC244_08170 [Alistipes senegalensis]|nr:hypothetical protein [Alistipes senegalensis]